MKALATELPGVMILEPRVFEDLRGATFEGYNRHSFREATGLEVEFVQDNFSSSKKGVLRGLHFQVVRPQGKLVRALRGEIFDVAVDLRRSSSTFGKWVGYRLSEANRRMMWIPPGFGHGFLVTSEGADVMYKLSDFWAPEHERVIAWNDAQLDVRWPLGDARPLLGPRDAAAPAFAEAELYA